MNLSPDDWVFWQSGFIKLNATIVFTWVVMAVLTFASWFVTRRYVVHSTMVEGTTDQLSDNPELRPSREQSLLEVLVIGMNTQIREVSQQEPGKYLPFVGTLFLFIAMSNLLILIPSAIYQAPTGSLSTTAALAMCVFVAVPIYGVTQRGIVAYLANYARPNVFMVPFNVIGELSRTLALAVRLYGNMMSGSVIVAILIGFVPLFVPVAVELLGLLTGVIQAYIFAILAMVYIASATRAKERSDPGTGETP